MSNLAKVCAALVIVPVASAWVVALGTQNKWFENPTGQVGWLFQSIQGVVDSAWFHWFGGIGIGFSLSVWIGGLRRRACAAKEFYTDDDYKLDTAKGALRKLRLEIKVGFSGAKRDWENNATAGLLQEFDRRRPTIEAVLGSIQGTGLTIPKLATFGPSVAKALLDYVDEVEPFLQEGQFGEAKKRSVSQSQRIEAKQQATPKTVQ